MNHAVKVAEQVVTLLEEGSFSATYKQAVLTALIDLCIERTSAKGDPPTGVTTRQLAERVIELYWPQTAIWGEHDARLLAQNKGSGEAKIVRLVREFRREVDRICNGTPTLAKGGWLCPVEHARLVDDVEWTLIEMPLPKLQRFGGQETGWLYRINWDDGANRPRLRDIRRYQRGEDVGFDNMVRFQDGVADAFVRLAGILRPFVLQHWAAKVAALNKLDVERLSTFLFGAERTALDAVREPLTDLQSGECFYCGGRMREKADVDHFIPWARRPDNSLHNLVAAHSRCNNAKRDFLAAGRHVELWRKRSVDHRQALAQIGERERWRVGDGRVLGVARGVYLGLSEDARLWVRKGEFEAVDRSVLVAVLGR